MTWRIIYRVDEDAIIIGEVFAKKTQSTPKQVIDACRRCLGYVKTLTTLQGSPPAKILLDDLATVDLDVAAFERGYGRPEGAGYHLDVTVTEQGPRVSA